MPYTDPEKAKKAKRDSAQRRRKKQKKAAASGTTAVPAIVEPRPGKHEGGRPTVWTPQLEDALCQQLQNTGCSFRDAAEACGITYETLKVRQRVDPEFSSLVAAARNSAKLRSLVAINTLCEQGNFAANTWRLERLWPEEFNRNRLELSGAIEHTGDTASNVSITNLIVAGGAASDGFYEFLQALADGHSESVAGGLPDARDAAGPDTLEALPPRAADRSRAR